MTTIEKDTADVILRGFDWSSILTTIGNGVTIVASSWTVDGNLTLQDGGFSSPYTRVTLSGGAADTTYILSNKVTLSDGEVYERSVKVLTTEHVYL